MYLKPFYSSMGERHMPDHIHECFEKAEIINSQLSILNFL